MLPFWPEYVTPDRLASLDGAALGVVTFGVPATDSTGLPAGVPRLVLPMPQLGAESLAEVWLSRGEVTYGRSGPISFAHDGTALFGSMALYDDDPELVARHAYEGLLALSRDLGYPHLQRVWHHLRDLNEGDGDRERYRRFCTGRHDAFEAHGWPKGKLPAASAVGMAGDLLEMSGGSLAIYFVASRTAGVQVENPRQVSAFDYPRKYGPRSPSFSRAMVVPLDGGSLLFISGTASVVGHETVHVGNVAAQLTETLANLTRILEAAAPTAGRAGTLADLSLVKTYVRHPADQPTIAAQLAPFVPNARVLYLESDICRSDLLLEIEAIAQFPR